MSKRNLALIKPESNGNEGEPFVPWYEQAGQDGLPANIDNERYVLAEILWAPDVHMDNAMARLRPETFFLRKHQTIFRVMGELWEAKLPVDAHHVIEQIKASGQEWPTYITDVGELIGPAVGHDNIGPWIDIIRRHALARHEITIFNQAITRLLDGEDAMEVLTHTDSKLIKAGQRMEGQRGKARHLVELAEAALQSGHEVSKRPNKLLGLATGFKDFDKMTLGLERKFLSVIAADTSMGKTAFALNVAERTRDGLAPARCLFITYEMSDEQLAGRLLASMAGVNSQKLRQGDLDREEFERVKAAIRIAAELRITIDGRAGRTLPELRSRVKLFKAEFGLDFLMLDYLQLMAGTGEQENRQQEVDYNARGLKELADDEDLHVMALSQLKRRGEKYRGKRPCLDDLRESGAIANHADIVAFIHRPEYYDPDNKALKGVAELIVAKQRNGPTGIVPLAFLAERTRFEPAWKE